MHTSWINKISILEIYIFVVFVLKKIENISCYNFLQQLILLISMLMKYYELASFVLLKKHN